MQKKRILIVGAGEAGLMIAEEILRQIPEYEIIGFIDDDPEKQNKKFLNIPILGTRLDIKNIVKDKQIDEVIIAIPSASSSTIQGIIDKCENLRIKIRIVPGIWEIIKGNVTIKDIRDIQPEDLLGREKVKINHEQIKHIFKNKNILITGAGGSIGSEIVKQLSKFPINNLILLDISEYNLYKVDLELKKLNIKYKIILGDIKDYKKLKHIFNNYNINSVFHAAAYKHVPLLETQIDEAIKNNIFGTKNLIELSKEYNIDHFVFISTDKAVKPKSIMGMTKKVAEAMCINANNEKTRFTAVRFGNVLGSQGSVVPLFKSQIHNGGPVTVTHPDIIRYFMTISEASQLVIQAACIGESGTLFILDMGEPIKILDLARQMIILSGYIPDRDIKIEFTGLRPGEKLVEELLTDEENLKTTIHKKIFIAKPTYKNLSKLNKILDDMKKNIYPPDNDKLKSILEEFCIE